MSIDFTAPTKLLPVPKISAWGKMGEASLVYKIARPEDLNQRYAELWMGAHPSAPSRVICGEATESLAALITQHPRELLGEVVAARFGGHLPFLFKVLSIDAPLSLQAHPDKLWAQRLHAVDAAHYPDENHKPEIAIALTPLTFVAGFHSPEGLKLVCESYRELQSLLTSETLAALLLETPPDTVREAVYRELLTSKEEAYEAAVLQIAERLRGAKSLVGVERYFLSSLAEHGARDRGLLTLFLMQCMTLFPGTGVFLPPRILHAYLEGDVVECMANSDNVVRAGLTGKFQDIPTLLEMLDYDAQPIIVSPTPVDGVRHYAVSVDEFTISHHQASTAALTCQVTGIEIVLVLDAQAEIVTHDKRYILSAGEVCVVPASVGSYSMLVSSCTQPRSGVYRVSIPQGELH